MIRGKVNKMNRRKEEGSTTLLYVVFLLIVVVAILGFISLLRESFLLKEMQHSMEIAAVTALRNNVDDEKLRVEEFYVNESAARRDYMAMMDQIMNNYPHIIDYRFERTDIKKNSDRWGLGVTNKGREQYDLDSIIIIKVKVNPIVDGIPVYTSKFYNARSNETFEVSKQGVVEGKDKELAIRVLGRVVYR